MSERFVSIHDAGIERHHPRLWFAANLAAVHAAQSCGLNPEQNKEAISSIVLRVLDVADPPEAKP